LTVTAGVVSGRPARNAAMRATFVPDSPSGVAQPRMTSSSSSSGTPAINARITSAAMSSGRVVRSDPRGAFPTAVRRPATITASFVMQFPLAATSPRELLLVAGYWLLVGSREKPQATSN
jgi:hypothetical protein